MKIPSDISEKLLLPLAVAGIIGLFSMWTRLNRLEVIVEQQQKIQEYFHGHPEP